LARIQRPERGREELDQHRSAPLLAPWDGTRGSGCDARRLSTAGLSATWRTMQASRAGAIRADAALRHGIMGNRRTPSRVRARGGCSITSPASFCYLIRSAAGQAVRIRRFLLFAMPSHSTQRSRRRLSDRTRKNRYRRDHLRDHARSEKQIPGQSLFERRKSCYNNRVAGSRPDGREAARARENGGRKILFESPVTH
jgi:hypothetical protein